MLSVSRGVVKAVDLSGRWSELTHYRLTKKFASRRTSAIGAAQDSPAIHRWVGVVKKPESRRDGTIHSTNERRMLYTTSFRRSP